MCNNFITSQLVSNIIILPFCQEKGNNTYLKKTLKINNTNAFLINSHQTYSTPKYHRGRCRPNLGSR